MPQDQSEAPSEAILRTKAQESILGHSEAFHGHSRGSIEARFLLGDGIRGIWGVAGSLIPSSLIRLIRQFRGSVNSANSLDPWSLEFPRSLDPWIRGFVDP